MNKVNHLFVKEVYLSIQGEAHFSGVPCIFIRLSGCPLRCKWCDTAYAFKGGEEVSVSELIQSLSRYSPIRTVEVTGGEPLAQDATVFLIDQLCDAGFQTMIETSGSEDISPLDSKCHIIMDLKCPDSKMEQHNLYSNIEHLKHSDDIKFVVASKSDFDWAMQICEKHDLFSKCNVLVSPAWGLIKPDVLTKFILESKKPFRLNIQLHKYIWSPRAKSV